MSKFQISYTKNPDGYVDPAWLFKNKCNVNSNTYIHTGDHLDYYIWVDDLGKAVYLIFEQSNGDRDWQNNFRFAKVVYKNQKSPIKAHKGFVHVYKSANDEVMNNYLQVLGDHPSYDSIVTGWSMGGALAHLAAEDINFRTRTDTNEPNTGVKPILITFGSPQVLWGDDTVKYFRNCCSKIYNFSHIRDIVTEVPLWKWGYRVAAKVKIALNKKNPLLWFNPHTTHTHYYVDEYYDYVEYV